jgi:hypothetical protein
MTHLKMLQQLVKRPAHIDKMIAVVKLVKVVEFHDNYSGFLEEFFADGMNYLVFTAFDVHLQQ